MKNHRFIVPKALKTQYLECIHEGHLGVTKCLQRAREYLFWVNYSRDIQEEVENVHCARRTTPLLHNNTSSTPTYHHFHGTQLEVISSITENKTIWCW